MMGLIRQWLLGVIAAAVCLSLLEEMVPKGPVKAIARMTGGLVMFLLLLKPWTNLELGEIPWEYREYQQQIDRQIDGYRDDYLQQMEAIIENELSAYISLEAESMGIECRVSVKTVLENEGPVPSEVSLDTEKHDALASWIAEELGIPEAQQHWEDER